MAQRKTHDVYAGNQKVGEVWENYDLFTPAEREAKKQKMIADMILKDLEEGRLRDTDDYKSKEAKAERNFKIRKALGIIFVLVAIGLIVFSLVNPQSEYMSEYTLFFLPPIFFGIGMGLTHSDTHTNLEKRRPTVDWGWCIGWMIGGGIGFFILNFIVLFGLARLNIL